MIGPWRKDGREIKLDRTAPFNRVWAEPVEKLAKEWGLSGRGLAKACRRDPGAAPRILGPAWSGCAQTAAP